MSAAEQFVHVARTARAGVVVLSCCLIFTAPTTLTAAETDTLMQSQQHHCADIPVDQARADIKAYMLDINACVQEGLYQPALSLALRAKALAQANNDSEGQLQSLNAEASVLFYLGALSEALTRYENIRQAWTPEQDYKWVMNAENNAAAVLNQLERPSEALPYAESALDRAVAQKNDIYIGSVSGTLASSLIKLKKYARARELLDTCKDAGARHKISLLIIGCAHVEAEMYAAQAMWTRSLASAELGLRASEESNQRSQLPELQLSKAVALRSLQQPDAALESAQSGLTIAQETQKLDSARQLWQFIADLLAERRDLSGALHAQREAAVLSQQIFDRQLVNVMAVQRVQREVEGKEREITLLKKENEVHQAKVATAQAQRATAILISMLAIAVFVIGFGRFMYRRDLVRAHQIHDELHHLHNLKDQFLANTSHELRTPLNGIIGLSDHLLADEGKPLPLEVREQLTMIHDCGSQLLQLVDDILDFSRVRADKMILNRTPVPLQQTIDDVVKLLNPLARAKKLTLRAELPQNLPRVMADPDRLRQVLHNLIGNAIKFTETGEIVVTAQPADGQIVVHVRDTGIGIPADKQSRIFEPFEQVDGSKSRRHGGTGLGLAIARALVRAHGGELRVYSEPQHGSDFLFNLPIAKF